MQQRRYPRPVAMQKWKEKYLRTVQQSYGKYPFFSEVYPVLENAIRTETSLLYDINMAIIKSFCDYLEIRPEYVRASELELDGQKSDLILDICWNVGADTYISDPSGRDYLDLDSFAKSNIAVKFNDFEHLVYPQRKTKGFVSRLSAMGLFMNCGFKEDKRIIMLGIDNNGWNGEKI